MNAVPCPNCGISVEYDSDIVECPECWEGIAWAVPFGHLSGGEFVLSTSTKGYWTTRTDQCHRCRKSSPFGSLEREWGVAIEREVTVCTDCLPAHRRSNERIRARR